MTTGKKTTMHPKRDRSPRPTWGSSNEYKRARRAQRKVLMEEHSALFLDIAAQAAIYRLKACTISQRAVIHSMEEQAKAARAPLSDKIMRGAHDAIVKMREIIRGAEAMPEPRGQDYLDGIASTLLHVSMEARAGLEAQGLGERDGTQQGMMLPRPRRAPSTSMGTGEGGGGGWRGALPAYEVTRACRRRKTHAAPIEAPAIDTYYAIVCAAVERLRATVRNQAMVIRDMEEALAVWALPVGQPDPKVLSAATAALARELGGLAALRRSGEAAGDDKLNRAALAVVTVGRSASMSMQQGNTFSFRCA